MKEKKIEWEELTVEEMKTLKVSAVFISWETGCPHIKLPPDPDDR